MIDLIKTLYELFLHNTNFNGYWNMNNTKVKDFRNFVVGDKDYVDVKNIKEIPQPNIKVGSDNFFSNNFESELD